MHTLEEVTYEAGRSALSDQESYVADIRQRTGTLLAAHALVASFLGATTLRVDGLDAPAWGAMAALLLGLTRAAVLLAPWQLRFAVDVSRLYGELCEQAGIESTNDGLGWLVSVAFGYEQLVQSNATKVRRMTMLSTALGVLMVFQTLMWLATLLID